MKDDFFKNKKVLVTGHTGFKGAWLSFYLYLLGSKVMGISLKPLYKFSLYEILNLRNKINSNYINILDEKRFQKKVLEFKPDIIFHLAAQALIKNSYLNPIDTWKTNLMGSINVLEVIKKSKKILWLHNKLTIEKAFRKKKINANFEK